MASLSPISGKLGERKAAHLLRRATYFITKKRIADFASMNVNQALAQLTAPYVFKAEQPIDPDTGSVWINNGTATVTQEFKLRAYVRNWQLNESRYDQTMYSKMSFFLHKIFVTSYLESTSARFFDYLALIRFYGLGSYKSLARKMTLDNLMLIYLNNTLNNKTAPNENYAREFLELFTIGKGEQIEPGNYTNYTEADVIAGAKLLTGFKTSTRGDVIDSETGIPKGRNSFSSHNTEPKQFSAAFGNKVISPATSAADMDRELNDYIEMIFAQKETARFYCRRLYRYMVAREITAEIEQDIIIPLADQLIADDYEVMNSVKILLASSHFYDQDDSISTDEIIGALIKSPLELFLTTTNLFEIPWQDHQTDTANLYKHLDQLVVNVILNQGGMVYYAPADVAGYGPYYQSPDYDLGWFTANTIICRYKLSEMLITGKSYLNNTRNIGGILDMASFVKDSGYFTDPKDPHKLIQELANDLFPEAPDEDRISYFLTQFLDDVTPEDWAYEWEKYLQTGKKEEVNLGLNKLLEAVLGAQEYQII